MIRYTNLYICNTHNAIIIDKIIISKIIWRKLIK